MVEEHHSIEESLVFSSINSAVPVSLIKGKHELFEKPFHDMEKYLLSCLPAGATWAVSRKVPQNSPNNTFESAKLVGIIDELAVAFLPHVSRFQLIHTEVSISELLQFCAEIGYLDPAKLRSKLTHEELERLDQTTL